MSETELRNADIDTALTEAKEAYVARNPKSFARFVEATAVMPGGNTRTVLHYAPFPLGIARGEGCRLWDLDGAEYIDFLGEYTAGIYGHSHPQDPRRAGSRAGCRDQLRRHQPDRGEVRPRRVRPFRAGARALHQLRHRSEPAGDLGRPHLHRAARR